MRTTLNIDDDLYKAVKSMADVENRSVGQIVSSLLRKALFSRDYSESDDGIPAFRVSESVPPLTPEMVRDADEDFI